MKKQYKSVVIKLIVKDIEGAIDGFATIPNATVVHGQDKGWVTVLGKEIKYTINFKSEAEAKAFKADIDEPAAAVNGTVFTLEYKYESEFQFSVELADIVKMEE